MNEIIHYVLYYGKYVIYLLIAFLILKSLFTQSFKQYHSKWSTSIDNFKFSTEEFYTLLRKELKSNGVVGMDIHIVRLKIGNAFSTSRKYMRVNWKEYQYDICAAPFGNGYFISWWLLFKNSPMQVFVSKIPFVGDWLSRKLYPVTYYKIDTASMFMTYCQQSVLKVVDQITSDKGIRILTESERKPMLGNVFKR